MRASGALLAALLSISSIGTGAAEEIKVIGFNIERGFKPNADPQFIADQMQNYTATDLWGISENDAQGTTTRLKNAAREAANGASVQAIEGTTSSDRLLILYREDKVDLLGKEELKDIQFGSGGRAPLVAHFKLKSTGTEFLFVVNHLHRTNETKRHNQARELNTWARLQELPIITIGDFNFDWNFIGDHSRDNGYDLLTKDDVFAWVRPDILTPTQCHETFKSVLDFAFVAGEAKQWPREAEILERQPDYCPDTDQKADHRPIRLVISVP